jgi:hypothetical protein
MVAPFIPADLKLRDLRVATADESGRIRARTAPLDISAVSQEGVYVMDVRDAEGATAGSRVACGTFDPRRLELDLSLEIDRHMKRGDAAPILALLDLQPDWQAQGQVQAKGELSGPVTRPRQLKYRASGSLRGWELTQGETTVARSLDTELSLNNRAMRFRDIRGEAFGGAITGYFEADLPVNERAEYRGATRFVGLELSQIERVFSDDSSRKGKLSGDYRFRLLGDDWNELRARANAVLEDGNIGGDDPFGRLLTAILDHIGVPGVPTASDAVGVFNMEGPLVTVERGALVGPVVGLEIEPGGKINLETKHVDLFIVGVAFREVQDLLMKVPVVNLVLQLRTDLTRLRLKGNWTASPLRLIDPQPVTTVRKATAQLLKGAAKEGGNLTDEVLELFGVRHGRSSRSAPDTSSELQQWNLPPLPEAFPKTPETGPKEGDSSDAGAQVPVGRVPLQPAD